MTKLFAAALAAGALALVAAAGAANPPAQASAFDRHFVVAAVQNDRFEIALASTYSRRGGTDKLCDFAKRLSTDHQRSLQELTTIAVALHVNVAQPLDPLLAYVSSQLGTMTPAAANAGGVATTQNLDAGFARLQVAAHRHAILEYAEAARAAADPQVRSYARSTLPILRQHLKMASGLQGRSGGVVNTRCGK